MPQGVAPQQPRPTSTLKVLFTSSCVPDGFLTDGRNPDGRLLASKGGRDEGFAVADIDLAQIAALRKKNGPTTTPAWGLYGGLYKKK